MRLWKRPILLAIAILLCCAFALPQSQPLLIPDGTIIEAKLVRGVDSAKAKASDAIEAETTWPVQTSTGAVIIPKGSHLLGHVTTTSAQTLGLTFDSVRLRDGSQFALNVTIRGAQPKLGSSENRVGRACEPIVGLGEGDRLENCSGGCCDYIARRPIGQVITEQRDNNEALFHSTSSSVKLPKDAKLVLLVGSLDDVCRSKGKVVPISAGKPITPADDARPLPNVKEVRPALVIANHQVVGCTDSASAWTDASTYKR